jgi:hypothetical protein
MTEADQTGPERADTDESKPDQKVGIEFVDILFALVIGEALDVLTRSGHMSAAGRTHLLFASLLTITSWVGYHRSAHRYTGEITFNFDPKRPRSELVPLGKFTIDIVLVVLYWLAVRTVESGFPPDSSVQPSWRPVIIIAVVSFGLYIVWDCLAWVGRGSPRREDKWKSDRRLASVYAFVVVVVIAGVTALVDPTSNWGVATVNIILTVVVLGYRVGKDTWAQNPKSARPA